MSCKTRDLTLDEALSDPVIGAAMRADRVDPRHFETLLRTTAQRLERDRGPRWPTVAAMAARSRRLASGDIAAW